MTSPVASFFSLITRRGLALGRLVVDVADALELSGLHQLGDAGGGDRDRRLVRHLGDDDLVGARALFDLGDGAEADRALPGGVGVDDPLAAHDQPAGGEVGALHEGHQVLRRGLGVVDEVDRGVDHLAEVVRRDVGGHADGDALAAVDQQVREPRREHDRLHLVARVVVDEVDRVLADAVEHAAWRWATGGTRCSGRRRRRSRASRSCRGHRPAAGGARSPGPCARGRRRSSRRRGGGTCP